MATNNTSAPWVGVDQAQGGVVVHLGGMEGRIKIDQSHFRDKQSAQSALITELWQYIQSLDDPWILLPVKVPTAAVPQFDVRPRSGSPNLVIGQITKLDAIHWSIEWTTAPLGEITITLQDINADSDIEVATALWRFAQPFRPAAPQP